MKLRQNRCVNRLSSVRSLPTVSCEVVSIPAPAPSRILTNYTSHLGFIHHGATGRGGEEIRSIEHQTTPVLEDSGLVLVSQMLHEEIALCLHRCMNILMMEIIKW